MRLSTLKRFASSLAPDVYIGRRKMPRGLQGLASGSVIFYAAGQSERERDLTILHELAHVLFDAPDGSARDGFGAGREQWREDRADRWATVMLDLLCTEAP